MIKAPEGAIVIGLDNGNKGGLAALSWSHGEIIDLMVMPVMEHLGHKEIDIKAVWEWASQWNPSRLIVAAEAPPHHCPSASALRSLALSFGKIVGFFEAKNVPVFRVPVRVWQKNLLRMDEKGLTKLLALDKAQSRWPEEDWLPTKRHRTPHDGLIDAALVAEHLRTGGDTGQISAAKKRAKRKAQRRRWTKESSKTAEKKGRSRSTRP